MVAEPTLSEDMYCAVAYGLDILVGSLVSESPVDLILIAPDTETGTYGDALLDIVTSIDSVHLVAHLASEVLDKKTLEGVGCLCSDIGTGVVYIAGKVYIEVAVAIEVIPAPSRKPFARFAP